MDKQRQRVPMAMVHIGLHKTGTTAFQEALDLAAPELLRLGVRVMQYQGPLYPDTPRAQAFHLANAVIRLDCDAYFRLREPQSLLPSVLASSKRSVKEAAACSEQLLVASMESLSLARDESEVRRIVSLLSPRQVHAVLVRRDRVAFLRSLRSQIMRLGLRSTTDFKDSCLYLEHDSWVADVEGLVSLYSSVLGPSNVHVIDYEQSILRDSTIVPALWAAMSLPREPTLEWIFARPWVNRTPRPELTPGTAGIDDIEDVETLKALALDAQFRLAAVHGSASWRITAPLRRLNLRRRAAKTLGRDR